MDKYGFSAGYVFACIVFTLAAWFTLRPAYLIQGYCDAAADFTERECRIIGTECQCASGDGWETAATWEGE